MRLSVFPMVAIIIVVLMSGTGCAGKVASLTGQTAIPTPTIESLPFSSPLIMPLAATDSELILFISFGEGHPSIYAVSPDNKDKSAFQILRLPEGFQVTGHMDWSPSAKKVAFGLTRGERSDIFVADLINLTIHNITAATAFGGSEPRWSPDGGHLAYVCGDYEPDICLIRPDGNDYAQLTFHPSRDINPSWSPDGTAIAYQTSRGGLSDIYVLNVKDRTERDLTLGISQNAQPAWSPNGEAILFQSDREGSMDIFVISLKDNRTINLTRNEALDADPQWSPNGEYIAFRSNRNGEWNLFVMKRDGSDLINLTAGWGPVFTYTWSPDSRSLAFASGHQSDNKIYKVSIDDRKVVQLTFGSSEDMVPLWIALKK